VAGGLRSSLLLLGKERVQSDHPPPMETRVLTASKEGEGEGEGGGCLYPTALPAWKEQGQVGAGGQSGEQELRAMELVAATPVTPGTSATPILVPLYPTVPRPRKPLLVPPLNFAMVAPGVYRSGYPRPQNRPFLAKLRLRSILCLSEEPYGPDGLAWVQEQGITLHHIPVAENKEPFKEMSEPGITLALCTLLDARNHPLLLHCNKGKHRVGCLVGCLRKLQHYSMTCIFDEYRR
jgi:tyrosine-protein phosphatase SIW14